MRELRDERVLGYRRDFKMVKIEIGKLGDIVKWNREMEVLRLRKDLKTPKLFME